MTTNASSKSPSKSSSNTGDERTNVIANLGQRITGVFFTKNKETIQETPTLQALKAFIGEKPTWILPKEIREKFKGYQSGLRTKKINQSLLINGKEVDYIAEKNNEGEDVYKEVVDSSTINQKHQQFLALMDTRLGIDNRDEKIKKDGMDDTKNSITVSQKKAEELYSSLERLGFPKGATNNYGIIQSRDTFNIRIFRPDGSPLSMLVSKDEVKFNFYAKNYGYIAIGLPNHK